MYRCPRRGDVVDARDDVIVRDHRCVTHSLARTAEAPAFVAGERGIEVAPMVPVGGAIGWP
jgi:hypothetical protein